MNHIALAEQVRRALQMFVNTLDDEQALEVPAVYDAWKPGKTYTEKEIISHGVNSVGDPQLYRVNQSHTAQTGWEPGTQAALFTPIGLDDSGYPVWAQPTGAHDAYNTGDIVNYGGSLYRSLIDGNTYSPDAYPAGWEAV